MENITKLTAQCYIHSPYLETVKASRLQSRILNIE